MHSSKLPWRTQGCQIFSADNFLVCRTNLTMDSLDTVKCHQRAEDNAYNIVMSVNGYQLLKTLLQRAVSAMEQSLVARLEIQKELTHHLNKTFKE